MGGTEIADAPLARPQAIGYNGGKPTAKPQGGKSVATYVFDTHRAVKDLEQAGFPEAQAEALVEIVGAAVGENAATKSDLDAQEQRLNSRIDAVEHKLNAEIRAVRADMRNMEQRLTLRFIAILLPSLGLLFAALRFLPG